MDEMEARLDRVESLVEQQQKTIEQQQETIERQQQTIERLQGDEATPDGVSVTRRGALRAAGLVGLLGAGVGTAAAGPTIGGPGNEVDALYTGALAGSLTPDGTQITELAGDGLEVSDGGLAPALSEGLALDTGQIAVDWGDASHLNSDGAVQWSNASGLDSSGIPTDFSNANDLDSSGNVQGGGANGRYLDSGDFQGPAEWGNPGETDTNEASGIASTVAGGRQNTSSGFDTTVGGGKQNTASIDGATVAGGVANTVTGIRATVCGGVFNVASAQDSTVPGGEYGAAENDNCFVWNDGTGYHSIPGPAGSGLSSDKDVTGEPVTGGSTFSLSATGGVRFITGSSSVTYIPSGSTGWSATSSRTAKTNIDPVDPEEALSGVDSLEIATWEYDGEASGPTHIGPMAEDFHEAFDVGDSDQHINSINADGVALAAIQALSEKLNETREQLNERETRIAELESRLAAVESEPDG